MRALIYYVATSLDGFIAHPDGSWNGMSMQGDHVDAFVASFATFGAVLMGRRTYDVGLAHGVTSPYPMIGEQLVVSRTLTTAPDPAIELVGDEVIERVGQLKAKPGAPVWLCGGGELAGHLWRAGLIDAVRIKLNPVVFGAGIRLFGAESVDLGALRLTDLTRFDSGVVQLHYAVD